MFVISILNETSFMIKHMTYVLNHLYIYISILNNASHKYMRIKMKLAKSFQQKTLELIYKNIFHAHHVLLF